MSWLQRNDWFTNLLSSVFRGLGGKYLGTNLTPAQEQANAFSAQQAQAQRDWETEMSNTAMQRQVSDMQKAGLNPALMYGGAGSSGASTPTASAPSSVSPDSGADLISLFMDMALLKAQKENIEADTKLKGAETENKDAETERTKALTPHEIDNIVSQIDLRESDMSKNEAEIAVDYANVALLDSDVAYREEFNKINLRLAELNVAKSEAERAKIEQETQNLIRDYALSFVEELVMRANAGLLSQQTKNALAENDLIQFNTKTAKYEAKLTKYNYEHADGNRIWDRVATGAGIVRDAGIATGAVVGGLSRGIASGASETITNTTQEIFGSKGQRLRTIVTHQNRNK